MRVMLRIIDVYSDLVQLLHELLVPLEAFYLVLLLVSLIDVENLTILKLGIFYLLFLSPFDVVYLHSDLVVEGVVSQKQKQSVLGNVVHIGDYLLQVRHSLLFLVDLYALSW